MANGRVRDGGRVVLAVEITPASAAFRVDASGTE